MQLHISSELAAGSLPGSHTTQPKPVEVLRLGQAQLVLIPITLARTRVLCLVS
jgi:hypothetical protein